MGNTPGQEKSGTQVGGVQGSSLSQDHESVLKRFEEVASLEYPFDVPERIKPTKLERVNLNSMKNLRPLLKSLCQFFIKISLPPLVIGFGCLAYFYFEGRWSSIFAALAMIGLIEVLNEPFFMHFITDGYFGGLGKGAGANEVKDGFFCKNTTRNQKIRERLAHFVKYRPTPYLYSGDLLTMGPFLMFKGSAGGRVNYKRFWVRVPSAPAPDGPDGPFKKPKGSDEDEAVAIDIIFPKDGYRKDKNTFLILHGLNGGSTEPYVLDLARRATTEGHTVAVMITRGQMKTHVKGMESFHGARTSDVGCAVDALLYALGGEKRGDGKPKNSKIVLVGFSMGGIIAANYTAKAKENSGLAGTVSFSGTLSSEQMLLPCPAASHSVSVWQPALAWGLKATIFKPNMMQYFKRGIAPSDVENIQTVLDIDAFAVCKYHGYKVVQDYYEDMSAGGRGDDKGIERLNGASVPLLAVHAIDDPISIYEVALADKVAMTENAMLLATTHGGHIGWPQGIFPSFRRWGFMMDVAMEFAMVVCEDE